MRIKAKLLDHSQLRALSSPIRAESFQCIRSLGRASVGEVAHALGRTPESVAYHVRILAEARLIEPVESRPTRRRAEVVYKPTATTYRLPDQSEDPEGHRLSHEVVLSGLRLTMRNYGRVADAIEAGNIHHATNLHVVRTQIRLSPEDRNRFFKMIDEASTFARKAHSSGLDDTEPLLWSSIVMPSIK